MILKVNKNVLEHILITAQSFLEKKDASSITSHVLLATTEEHLEIKATDFEVGITMKTCNITAEQPGLATANGKKLLDIVKILKDDDVTLKTEENFLHIEQEKSKFKLPMFNASEYPDFPETETKAKFEIEPIQFLHSVKKISPAIDTNNPKYELNGALIDLQEDKIHFVATDTRRLAVVTLEKHIENSTALIIPKKAISEIQKLFFDEMEIFYDENTLLIRSENFLFFTKLINGKYPDYQRIIPKEYKIEFMINRDQMIDHIKQIATISQEVKLKFVPGAILFESLNEDNIEAKTEMPFETSIQEEVVLAVNSRYILDFLTQVEQNEFKLSYNDATLPFTLQSENFITVVMPIML